jgi:Flp pilus assembly protein TadG
MSAPSLSTWMTLRTRSPRHRRGNGTLEAALVLPVLLAFSMGMVEFGYYLYAKHQFQAAARDGARTAILSTATHAQAQAAVNNTMSSANFSASAYDIEFTNAATTATISNIASVAKGTGIKVTVRTKVAGGYGSFGVRPLGVIPANKPVIGITTMIKE